MNLFQCFSIMLDFSFRVYKSFSFPFHRSLKILVEHLQINWLDFFTFLFYIENYLPSRFDQNKVHVDNES